MLSSANGYLSESLKPTAHRLAILLFAVMAAGGSFWNELRTLNSEFEESTEGIHSTLIQRTANLETVLISLVGLYQSTDNLSTAEHMAFSEQLLKAYPSIGSILHMERISKDGLTDFVARMKEQGFIGFRLKNGKPTGSTKTASQLPFHLPVNFIEPMTPHSARLLGFDLSNHPELFNAISNAIDTGKTTASITTRLDNRKTPMLLVLKALYLGRYAPHGIEQRRRMFIGLEALLIEPRHFIADINSLHRPLQIRLSPTGDLETASDTTATTDSDSNWFALKFDKEMDVFGQTLSLSIRWGLSHQSINWWRFGGVWLTLMIFLFLAANLYQSRRLARIQQRKANAAIAAEGARFTQVIDTAFDAVITADRKGRILSWNQHANVLFGYAKDSVLGQQLFELILTPKSIQAKTEQCKKIFEIKGSKPSSCHLEAQAKNSVGIEFPVELAISSAVINHQFILSVFVRDISKRKEAEEKLRQGAAVIENTNDGVVITDAEKNIVSINHAVTEITGFSEDEIIGRNPRLWKSDRHHFSFYQNMWSVIEQDDHWRGEIWNRRKNGEIFPCWLSISVVRDDETEDIKHYVSILSDISVIKDSEQRLQHLAHHDPLTDLPNRVLFNARLEHALEHAHRGNYGIGVMFLDIDNFKQINDGLGHPVGDALLKSVAKRLRSLVRKDDTVARISGDEFAILLEEITDAQGVADVATKIVTAFETPFETLENQLHITHSIGISLYPNDGDNITDLLKNADAAMYQAKVSGKNRFSFYTSDLTEEALKRVNLESQLRLALKQEEFQLHFQPQYELATGRIIGVEALLRLRHPETGWVDPLTYIPIAESCGLIIPIGEWVLREALARIKLWRQAGLGIERIGINVAVHQIHRSDFFETVSKALEEAELEPACLELEVTESFFMGRAKADVDCLQQLRRLGVNIAIDDFGTGYSSLSYLKHLPINKIKLDRSFVRDIPADPDDEAIAKAIIALGKSMRLQIVAEGVETKEQLDFVRAEGCNEVQGFIYSHPLPEEELRALISHQQASEDGNDWAKATNHTTPCAFDADPT